MPKKSWTKKNRWVFSHSSVNENNLCIVMIHRGVFMLSDAFCFLPFSTLCSLVIEPSKSLQFRERLSTKLFPNAAAQVRATWFCFHLQGFLRFRHTHAFLSSFHFKGSCKNIIVISASNQCHNSIRRSNCTYSTEINWCSMVTKHAQTIE